MVLKSILTIFFRENTFAGFPFLIGKLHFYLKSEYCLKISKFKYLQIFNQNLVYSIIICLRTFKT